MQDIDILPTYDAGVNSVENRKKLVAAYDKAAAVIESEIIKLNQLHAAHCTYITFSKGNAIDFAKKYKEELEKRIAYLFELRAKLSNRFHRLTFIGKYLRLCTVVCGIGQDYESISAQVIDHLEKNYSEAKKDNIAIDIADNNLTNIHRYTWDQATGSWCYDLIEEWEIYGVDNHYMYGFTSPDGWTEDLISFAR
jgi:hypothetical protein